jgi:hypothetical protein
MVVSLLGMVGSGFAHKHSWNSVDFSARLDKLAPFWSKCRQMYLDNIVLWTEIFPQSWDEFIEKLWFWPMTENELAVSPEQRRAAHGLLGWSHDRMVGNCDVMERTIKEFALGTRVPRASSIAAIRGALEPDGVEFVQQSPSVRLKQVRR